jgi:hypothetical protein
MTIINLKDADKLGAFKNQTHQERRVQAIRKVLLENVDKFEEAGWAFDADRFAVWLEATQWFVSSSSTNASFHNVPYGAEPSEGALDFNKPETILAQALVLVEREAEEFHGEFDSPADFVEASWYSMNGEQAVPDDLKWVIDWGKLWEGSWSYETLDVPVFDRDGKFRHFFWANN